MQAVRPFATYHKVANKKLALAKNGVTVSSSVCSQTSPRYGEACMEHTDEVTARADHGVPGWTVSNSDRS